MNKNKCLFCNSNKTIPCSRCQNKEYCFDHWDSGIYRMCCPKCYQLQHSDKKYLIIDDQNKPHGIFIEYQSAIEYAQKKGFTMIEVPILDYLRKI